MVHMQNPQGCNSEEYVTCMLMQKLGLFEELFSLEQKECLFLLKYTGKANPPLCCVLWRYSDLGDGVTLTMGLL